MGILLLSHRFLSCFRTRNGLIYATIMHSHFYSLVTDRISIHLSLRPRVGLAEKRLWQDYTGDPRRRGEERNYDRSKVNLVERGRSSTIQWNEEGVVRELVLLCLERRR